MTRDSYSSHVILRSLGAGCTRSLDPAESNFTVHIVGEQVEQVVKEDRQEVEGLWQMTQKSSRTTTYYQSDVQFRYPIVLYNVQLIICLPVSWQLCAVLNCFICLHSALQVYTLQYQYNRICVLTFMCSLLLITYCSCLCS